MGRTSHAAEAARRWTASVEITTEGGEESLAARFLDRDSYGGPLSFAAWVAIRQEGRPGQEENLELEEDGTPQSDCSVIVRRPPSRRLLACRVRVCGSWELEGNFLELSVDDWELTSA